MNNFRYGLVNNFQNIRTDLYQAVLNKDQLYLREEQLTNFAESLSKKKLVSRSIRNIVE